MKASELIEELKKYPSDAIVGTPYGLGHAFNTITHLTCHEANIVDGDKIIGNTYLVHIHNDREIK